MIITWYTDPSKGSFTEGSTKFSSYYQFDTVSQKFVRIRLELGRSPSSSGGDQGDTGAFFKSKRYVGFSNDPTVRSSQPAKWSINKEGQLCFDGKALQTTPSKGLNTYDTSSNVFNDSTFIHKGNKITEEPNLPEDIAPKHLSLIANDAVIKGGGVNLTAANASGTDLATALKTKVGSIVGKDFKDITDNDLLAKLKEQISTIKTNEIQPSKASLDTALEDVNKLLTEIKTQIEEGMLIPNQNLEKAALDLNAKIEAAQKASTSGEGIKEAIANLAKSKTALNTQVEAVESKSYEALKNQVEQSDAAVKTAQADSERWENIDTEYANAEKAKTINEYEESIGIAETETV
ncbi:hypothetical protein [Aquimarina rhabdastrellae]